MRHLGISVIDSAPAASLVRPDLLVEPGGANSVRFCLRSSLRQPFMPCLRQMAEEAGRDPQSLSVTLGGVPVVDFDHLGPIAKPAALPLVTDREEEMSRSTLPANRSQWAIIWSRYCFTLAVVASAWSLLARAAVVR